MAKNRNFTHIDDTEFPYPDGINPYKYENNFDYSQYDKTQMRITVCRVPWDVGLIHVGNAQIGGLGNVVFFETKEARDEWMDSIELKYTWETNYREYHTGGHIKVPLPYEKAVLFNYVFVEYDRLPVDYAEGGKDRFFFFIRECKSEAPSTCDITILRDTFQTFIYDIAPNISYMMLERGHAPMSIIDADRYLQNPIENNGYLLAEDVSYSSSYKRKIASNIVLNAGNMWAIVVSSGNPSSNWGSKLENTWNTPDGNILIDGQPAMHAIALSPGDLSMFLDNVDAQAPQFKQTIKGVFFIAQDLVELAGPAFSFCGVDVRRIKQKTSTKNLIQLTKQQFGFGANYENLAKLYTYPYSYLEISDENGDVTQLRIEETSGNLSLTVTTSLAYPWICLDGRLTGAGSGSAELTFSNVNAHTFDIAGNWYDHLYKWNIPSFAVIQSSAIAYDYETHFDRAQRALENQTAYDNAELSAETGKANADASATTAKANADASDNTSKTNADADATTTKTNADRSALAANGNADATAATAQINADASAATAQTNSNNSALTTRDNANLSASTAKANSDAIAATSKTNADANTNTAYNNEDRNIQRTRVVAADEMGLRTTLKNLANSVIEDETYYNNEKLGADMNVDNSSIVVGTFLTDDAIAATSAVNVGAGMLSGAIGGVINGAMTGGALAGGPGAAAGAIGGAVSSVIGAAATSMTTTITISNNVEMAGLSADANVLKASNSSSLNNAISAVRRTLNNDQNRENNIVVGKITRENADNAETNNTATKNTALANAQRNYDTDTANNARTYNTAVSNNNDAYDTDVLNASNSHNTTIANDLRAYNTAIANAQRTYDAAIANNSAAYNKAIANNNRTLTTALANNERTYDTALANNERTYDTALANAERSKNTADEGILNDIKQAALRAPREFGSFNNGENSTTRPQGLFCNIVTQSKDAIEQAGDYFLRYGYAVNRSWEFTTFNLMPHFTYWKCSDVWIKNNTVPDAYMDEIRFFLLGGVCVWRRPEDIGNISIYDNV